MGKKRMRRKEMAKIRGPFTPRGNKPLKSNTQKCYVVASNSWCASKNGSFYNNQLRGKCSGWGRLNRPTRWRGREGDGGEWSCDGGALETVREFVFVCLNCFNSLDTACGVWRRGGDVWGIGGLQSTHLWCGQSSGPTFGALKRGSLLLGSQAETTPGFQFSGDKIMYKIFAIQNSILNA